MAGEKTGNVCCHATLLDSIRFARLGPYHVCLADWQDIGWSCFWPGLRSFCSEWWSCYLNICHEKNLTFQYYSHALSGHSLRVINNRLTQPQISMSSLTYPYFSFWKAFVSEISDARWRTTLNSITGASYLLGLVVIYSLGAVLPWRTIVWTSIAFPVLAFMCSFVSHESPSWLVSKGIWSQITNRITSS